ncbi:hypothetical protein J2S15_002328 [Breznakia pachnodae]|uniref:Uncharacterized protein n=1 Tax=Breznakia pachnodae TaxID=265178 RepID=A0ABU0E3V9_9FIRM|nr:hypothetical protein [Breznakia pachnodae]
MEEIKIENIENKLNGLKSNEVLVIEFEEPKDEN